LLSKAVSLQQIVRATELKYLASKSCKLLFCFSTLIHLENVYLAGFE